MALETPTLAGRAGVPTLPPQRRVSLRGPVVLTIAFSAIFIWRASFTYRGNRYFTLFDDAMISMRYARNLAHGHGLVWNVGGPHVEGYTNFLWTLWMSLVHVLGFRPSIASLVVSMSGVVLLAVNLWLVRSIAELVAPDRRAVAIAAVWLTALCYPLVFWTLRGMEVGLLAVVLSAMSLFALRRRNGATGGLLWLGVLGAVAILTRTDAALPVATIALFWVAWSPGRERGRAFLVLLTGLGGILAAHTLLRFAYYHDALPNTYYLKLAGAPLAGRLSRGAASFGVLACASLLAPLALAAFHVFRRRRLEAPTGLLLAVFAVPAVYSIYVGGDTWEYMQYANRYLTTGVTLLLVVAALGIDDLVTAPPRLRARALVCGGGLAVAGVVLAIANAIPTSSLQYDLRTTGQEPVRVLLTVVVVITLAMVGLRLGRGESTRVAAGLLAGAAALLMSGQAFITWRANTGQHVQDDNTMAIYGLELRQATAPDATIAVVWAGAGPYYDNRPAVDLLGKSDAHIAKESMRKGVQFYPGHTKWDYGWSIGHLQPDLVAGLVRPTTDETLAMPTYGYDQLIPGVWVRRSSNKVDRALLESLLRATPRVGQLIGRDL